MDRISIYTLLPILLSAAFWNFFIAMRDPQRIPRTKRGCVIWAGVEGMIIGAALVMWQGLIDNPGGIELVTTGFGYGFGWFMMSMVTKNQYRRSQVKLSIPSSDETEANHDQKES